MAPIVVDPRAGSPDPRFEREFVTPEGIDLRLTLATAGERAAGFLIDIVLLALTFVVLTIVILLTMSTSGGQVGQLIGMLWMLGFFVARNGYFLAFELGARAATPGKRIVGLRVISRDGGRLSGEAVVARNAMRELEVAIPLSFLAYLGAASQGDYTWLAALAWVAVFLFFPLFNRDRLRVGDLIAGTWVVRAPRRKLGHSVAGTAPAPGFTFTDVQLDAYGEYELQALEEVLRREDELAMIVVARTIRQRIGWSGEEGQDQVFLQAYYAALCARLERNMLFGKRRADKHQRG